MKTLFGFNRDSARRFVVTISGDFRPLQVVCTPGHEKWFRGSMADMAVNGKNLVSAVCLVLHRGDVVAVTFDEDVPDGFGLLLECSEVKQ